MSDQAPIQNRYDFVLIYDVENGNPNGDPDAGNMPRVDPYTGLGIVTDVCLKRKIRNYVDAAKRSEPGFEIYIKENISLNHSDERAFSSFNLSSKDEKRIRKAKKDNPELDVMLKNFMCDTFYDIRTFGAVMTTFVKASLNYGQVRGPVQIGFSKSIDPVVPHELTITRTAITTDADAKTKTQEMGKKFIIPYALYRCEGFISASLAQQSTGFSEIDLQLFWEAIQNMFELDRSASRGKMTVRGLYIFKHKHMLGNCSSQLLFDLIKINKNSEVSIPSSFSDYNIIIETEIIPPNVELIRK